MHPQQTSTSRPLFHDRSGVADWYPQGTWQRAAYDDFFERVSSKASPFPCHFGAAGLRKDELRFFFSDDGDVAGIAHALASYLGACRAFGQNTSFVVMLESGPAQSLQAYHASFWKLLQGLRQLDPSPWPAHIPADPEDPAWEFCFAGEPAFVVCTTPAHVRRPSRHSSVFSLLFQPRWVFANILDTPEKARKAFDSVRVLLKDYDPAALSPYLGMYGDPDNREHLQYFLGDDDQPLGCPFGHGPASMARRPT